MATKADIVIVRFDPEGFAKWLTNAYENSKFKSITKLASAVGSNKATMSRIMNAAPQTLTGKPTRVQPEMVKKLATVLNADIEEGLRLAGFPIYDKNIERPKNIPDFFEGLERLGIEVEFASDGNFDNYTPEDLEDLKAQIAAITSAKAKKSGKPMKNSIEPPQNALVLRLKVVETNNEKLTQNAKHTTAFERIRHRRDRKHRMQRLKTISHRTKAHTDTGRKA